MLQEYERLPTRTLKLAEYIGEFQHPFRSKCYRYMFLNIPAISGGRLFRLFLFQNSVDRTRPKFSAKDRVHHCYWFFFSVVEYEQHHWSLCYGCSRNGPQLRIQSRLGYVNNVSVLLSHVFLHAWLAHQSPLKSF